MARLSVSCLLALCLVAIQLLAGRVAADQLQLSSVLPKLDAIYEDSKTLLLKNTELKAKILDGLRAQINAKLAKAHEMANNQPPKPTSAVPTTTTMPTPSAEEPIDFSEMDEFNKWVEVNLEYAIKNTRATIDALKEEAAAQGAGMVDYSDQAIADGIEGVKYWQSAVIFQDKTLKNEKFETK